MYSSNYWRCFHPSSSSITEGNVTSPNASLLVNKVSNSIANSSHQSSPSCLSVKGNCVQSGDRVKYSFEPISTLKNGSSGSIFSSTFNSTLNAFNSLNMVKIAHQTDSPFYHTPFHNANSHHGYHQQQQQQQQQQQNQHELTAHSPLATDSSNVIASPSEYLIHLQKSLNCKAISNPGDLQQTFSSVNIHPVRKVNANRDSLFINSFDLPSTSTSNPLTQTSSSSTSSHLIAASELNCSTSEPIKVSSDHSSSSSSSSSCYRLQVNSYPHIYDLLGNRLNNLTPETTHLIHPSTHCNSNKDTYNCINSSSSSSRQSKSITNKSRNQSKFSRSSEIVSLDFGPGKKKPRCPRTCFTYEQLNMLERYFNESSQYPDSNIKFTLAQLTNLSQARISVWFKNRRAKHRKAIKLSSSSFVAQVAPAHN